MKNIKGFIDKYLSKKTNDQSINDYRDRINFHLCSTTSNMMFFSSTINNPYEHHITLDNEDIEYFYKKYSALLNKELSDQINQLYKQYNKTITELPPH
jgi:uncharacterized protein YPO0396